MTSFLQFITEGVKTKNSNGDKFEVQILKNVSSLLKTNELTKSLVVSRQDEDRKYYSDIKVSNGKNNVWIEVKMDHRANLGGPSFKYIDGHWQCTTASDNLMTNIMIDYLTDNSQEFIDFCNKKLADKLDKESRTLKLPTDLPDIMDDWVKEHKFESGDKANKLYICDPIEVNDFGQKITSYYMQVKREPAYYIQIGDNLFIFNKEYNPLGLKTQDGQDLKELKEVYKSGTFYFRAKGGYKESTDKYYYNITVDTKLTLANNLDDYKCSLKTKDKFPIIVIP